MTFGKDTPVGFIGLGVMGGGMAHCLLRQGFAVHVSGRRPEALAPFVAAGAQAQANPADVARACKLVILCLSDDAAVEQVLFGAGGLAEGLAAGSCVVDTSTIAASSARAFGERLQAQGVSFLDAPISGGQQGAESGTLNTMVGGPAEALEACKPVLQAFCKTITHVGAVGAGQTVKSCNQVAVAGALLGVADAIALAKSQGVDPNVMRDVLLFKPGFRVNLMRKDLRIALKTAAGAGAVLAGAPVAEALLDELVRDGRGELDWAVLGQRVQEKRSG
jgi:2-hydroxy-3-oxopropionate reductase